MSMATLELMTVYRVVVALSPEVWGARTIWGAIYHGGEFWSVRVGVHSCELEFLVPDLAPKLEKGEYVTVLHGGNSVARCSIEGSSEVKVVRGKMSFGPTGAATAKEKPSSGDKGAAPAGAANTSGPADPVRDEPGNANPILPGPGATRGGCPYCRGTAFGSACYYCGRHA